ncbi:MAG: hypothetical protein WD509_00875 [Candidatus Paceibacterota bacterium]
MNVLWRKIRKNFYLFIGSTVLGSISLLLMLYPFALSSFFDSFEGKKYEVDTSTDLFTNVSLRRSGVVNFIDYANNFVDIEFQDLHFYKETIHVRVFITKETIIDSSTFSFRDSAIYAVQKTREESIRNIKTGQQLYFRARTPKDRLEAVYINYGDVIF